MTERFRRLYFILMFALVFYVAGAAFVQSFVNYPTWNLIGAVDFKWYHQAMGSLIIWVMVLPWFVEILLTVLLFWLRPQTIPRRAVAVALILNLIALASTIMIQLPIQNRLSDYGPSPELLERLLATDPIRWIPLILKMPLYLWMMYVVARTSGSESREEIKGRSDFGNYDSHK